VHRRFQVIVVPSLTEHDQRVLRILIHTGADVGEVFSAKVRDCELDRSQPRIRFRRTKTRTIERLPPFPTNFVDELRGQVAKYDLRPGDTLFGMFDRNSLDRLHQRTRKAIGRNDLRLKDFRHVAAIAWMRGGAGLEQVKNWLGHSRINQTFIFANFAPDDAFDSGVTARAARYLAAETTVLPLRAAI
jgi:integrase